MYLQGPLWVYAVVLAVVSGTLLASGHYVGSAIAGVIAALVLAAWNRAVRRGEHRRDGLQ